MVRIVWMSKGEVAMNKQKRGVWLGRCGDVDVQDLAGGSVGGVYAVV